MEPNNPLEPFANNHISIEPQIPNELNLIPIREIVLFPMLVYPLGLGRENSIKLVNDTMIGGDHRIGVSCLKDPNVENPSVSDVHRIGTMVVIQEMTPVPEGIRLIVQGIQRFEILGVVQTVPYLRVTFRPIEEPAISEQDQLEVEALNRDIAQIFNRIVQLSPDLPDEIQNLPNNVQEPNVLTDLIASQMPRFTFQERQEILETIEIKSRMSRLRDMLSSEVRVLEMSKSPSEYCPPEMMRQLLQNPLRKTLDNKWIGTSVQQLRAIIEQISSDTRSQAWSFIDRELQTGADDMLRLDILRSVVDLLPTTERNAGIRQLISEVMNKKFAARYLTDLIDVCKGRLRTEVVVSVETASEHLTAGERAERLMTLSRKVRGATRDRLERKANSAAADVNPFTSFAEELLTSEIERLAWGGLWREAWNRFRAISDDLFARAYYSLKVIEYVGSDQRRACLETIISDLDSLPDNGQIWIGIRLIPRLYEYGLHQTMFDRTWQLIDRQAPSVLRCAMQLAICNEANTESREWALEKMLIQLWDVKSNQIEAGPIPSKPYTFIVGLPSPSEMDRAAFLDELGFSTGANLLGKASSLANIAIKMCPTVSGKAAYIAWRLILKQIAGQDERKMLRLLGVNLIGKEFEDAWSRYSYLMD